MVRHKRWWHFAQSILVVALAVNANCAAGQESDVAKAFNKHWAAAEKAAGDKNFREAMARYGDVVALLPFEPSSRYKLACCLVRLGETDRALAELKVAVECGWADADALDRDEDWRPLRGDERFAELVNAAAACRDEKLLLYADDRVGRDRPAPLLVVLHGLGCGPRGEMPYWKPVADELGMVVVAPRSGTEFGPMLHGWQKAGAKNSSAADFFDMDSARERVDAAIEEAARLYKIDRGAVVLAGYSQGGGVVLGCQKFGIAAGFGLRKFWSAGVGVRSCERWELTLLPKLSLNHFETHLMETIDRAARTSVGVIACVHVTSDRIWPVKLLVVPSAVPLSSRFARPIIDSRISLDEGRRSNC